MTVLGIAASYDYISSRIISAKLAKERVDKSEVIGVVHKKTSMTKASLNEEQPKLKRKLKKMKSNSKCACVCLENVNVTEIQSKVSTKNNLLKRTKKSSASEETLNTHALVKKQRSYPLYGNELRRFAIVNSILKESNSNYASV